MASESPFPSLALRFLGLMAAVGSIAVAAQVEAQLPLTPVPQTAQTLAVVAVGLIFGAFRGTIAVALYVVLGVAGVPIFADGGAGVDTLTGPTGGYLVGFVAGAWVAGSWHDRRPEAGIVELMGAALVAHVVILGAGWVRLATLTDAATAWDQGVRPFLGGGAMKSVVAGLLTRGIR